MTAIVSSGIAGTNRISRLTKTSKEILHIKKFLPGIAPMAKHGIITLSRALIRKNSCSVGTIQKLKNYYLLNESRVIDWKLELSSIYQHNNEYFYGMMLFSPLFNHRELLFQHRISHLLDFLGLKQIIRNV